MFLQVPISKTTYLCKTSMHIFSTEFVRICSSIWKKFKSSLQCKNLFSYFSNMSFPIANLTKLQIRFRIQHFICKYFFSVWGPLKIFPCNKNITRSPLLKSITQKVITYERVVERTLHRDLLSPSYTSHVFCWACNLPYYALVRRIQQISL